MRTAIPGGLAALVLCLGCSSDGVVEPPKAPVAGVVALDGQPMTGGEVRFVLAGHPVQTVAVENGAFRGEAYVGSNLVNVLWEVEGPPNPMNPEFKLLENRVAARFAAADSPLRAEVPAAGATDLKFEVSSGP